MTQSSNNRTHENIHAHISHTQTKHENMQPYTHTYTPYANRHTHTHTHKHTNMCINPKTHTQKRIHIIRDNDGST